MQCMSHCICGSKPCLQQALGWPRTVSAVCLGVKLRTCTAWSWPCDPIRTPDLLGQTVIPEEDQPEMIEKIAKGNFTMRIMYEQFQNLTKMGPMSQARYPTSAAHCTTLALISHANHAATGVIVLSTASLCCCL